MHTRLRHSVLNFLARLLLVPDTCLSTATGSEAFLFNSSPSDVLLIDRGHFKLYQVIMLKATTISNFLCVNKMIDELLQFNVPFVTAALTMHLYLSLPWQIRTIPLLCRKKPFCSSADQDS